MTKFLVKEQLIRVRDSEGRTVEVDEEIHELNDKFSGGHYSPNTNEMRWGRSLEKH